MTLGSAYIGKGRKKRKPEKERKLTSRRNKKQGVAAGRKERKEGQRGF